LNYLNKVDFSSIAAETQKLRIGLTQHLEHRISFLDRLNPWEKIESFPSISQETE